MNGEGRNIVFAIIACIGFYLAFNSYMAQKYPKAPTPATDSASQPTSPATATSETPSQPAQPQLVNPAVTYARLDPSQLEFETPQMKVRFNQDNSALQQIEFKQYRQSNDKNSANYQLVASGLTFQGYAGKRDAALQGFNTERDQNRIRFWRDEGNWRISQEFVIPESGYGIDLNVTYQNISDRSQELLAGLLIRENIPRSQSSGGFFAAPSLQHASLIVDDSTGVNKIAVDEFCDEFAASPGPAYSGKAESIKYIGIDEHYFLTAIQPLSDKFDFIMTKSGEHAGDGCPIAIQLSQPQGAVAAGESVSLKFKAYLGPKEVSIMDNHSPKLESSLDLGWFGIVGQPLLLALKAVNQLVGNWGIAIIIITVLLKILFFPLNQAAAVSMKKMQKLQPQMQALREKYKDDPRRQQQELMKFMATHKINPAKGCIPILPQIPVFIAFYNVLSHAIELRHAPFYGWLQDLSAADPYYVTPVILGAGMFIQQKLTPNPSMDKAQERIMLMMPIIFTAMFFSLPAGMVLYMIANTIVSIAQQHWINRRLT
jgi:YidC/Oxa1 family membrane protein insertase